MNSNFSAQPGQPDMGPRERFDCVNRYQNLGKANPGHGRKKRTTLPIRKERLYDH